VVLNMATITAELLLACSCKKDTLPASVDPKPYRAICQRSTATELLRIP
jgi:hypothetical protein